MYDWNQPALKYVYAIAFEYVYAITFEYAYAITCTYIHMSGTKWNYTAFRWSGKLVLHLS